MELINILTVCGKTWLNGPTVSSPVAVPIKGGKPGAKLFSSHSWDTPC